MNPRPEKTPPATVAQSGTLQRVMVAVPALNEAETVADIGGTDRRRLPGAHIVVVDDGSTDDGHVGGVGRAVVLHTPSTSVSGALRTAFLDAAAHDFRRSRQVDADGQQ